MPKSNQASIQALKYYCNALAPVSSLPTEITTIIFSFVRSSDTLSAFKSDKRSNRDPLAWLRVTHVCHQWREIALGQPDFWNHIDFTYLSPAGAAEILARAKTAPLYLKARIFDRQWGDAQFSAFQEQLQACIPRICHLSLDVNPSQYVKILEALMSPAPTLEHLTITYNTFLYFEPEPIPDTLFASATPRLSSLKLHGGGGIWWESPLLRGLTHLDIRRPCFKSFPYLWLWLDALDKMPQLEVLTLQDVVTIMGHEEEPFPFRVDRIATLPSLTHFNISDCPRGYAVALAYLDLPALTCLNIEADYCPDDEDEMQDIFPYVAQHSHGSQDTQPLQSVLIWGKKTHGDIFAWPAPKIDVEVQESTSLAAMAPARVSLSLPWYCWWNIDDPNEVFCTAMRSIPLDAIVTLIAKDFLTSPFDKPWLFDLPKLPRLQRLRLASVIATELIDWLQADKGGCDDPLLPSLKELVVVDAHLNEAWTLSLCEVLMKRVEQGVPLEMLDLRTCRPDPGYPAAVRLLGDIVVDVLGPEETLEARAQIISMWDNFPRSTFDNSDTSREEEE